jgi:hypothetical protein
MSSSAVVASVPLTIRHTDGESVPFNVTLFGRSGAHLYQ